MVNVAHEEGIHHDYYVAIMDVVDPYDPTPKYRQIARSVVAQIKAGELEPMAPIPSESRMVQIHGVARETVRQAVALLREQGWVFTIQARGTYVSPRERWPEDVPHDEDEG